jgi:hypothetical protein
LRNRKRLDIFREDMGVLQSLNILLPLRPFDLYQLQG